MQRASVRREPKISPERQKRQIPAHKKCPTQRPEGRTSGNETDSEKRKTRGVSGSPHRATIGVCFYGVFVQFLHNTTPTRGATLANESQRGNGINATGII